MESLGILKELDVSILSLNGSLQSQITRKNVDFSLVFRYGICMQQIHYELKFCLGLADCSSDGPLVKTAF